MIPRSELAGTVLLGELGLDGRVRPVRGILPAVLAAAQAGFTRVVVPVAQAGEAALVEGLDVLGVGSLGQLVALLRGDPVPEVQPVEVPGEAPVDHRARPLDLADVVGQVQGLVLDWRRRAYHWSALVVHCEARRARAGGGAGVGRRRAPQAREERPERPPPRRLLASHP